MITPIKKQSKQGNFILYSIIISVVLDFVTSSDPDDISISSNTKQSICLVCPCTCMIDDLVTSMNTHTHVYVRASTCKYVTI